MAAVPVPPVVTAPTAVVVVVRINSPEATASMAAVVLLVMEIPVETLPMAAQVPAAAPVEPAPMGGPVAVSPLSKAAAAVVLAIRR